LTVKNGNENSKGFNDSNEEWEEWQNGEAVLNRKQWAFYKEALVITLI